MIASDVIAFDRQPPYTCCRSGAIHNGDRPCCGIVSREVGLPQVYGFPCSHIRYWSTANIIDGREAEFRRMMDDKLFPLQDERLWDALSEHVQFRTPGVAAICEEMLGDRSSIIIDAGCGYGRVLAELEQLGYRSLWGFDLSSHMIERATRSLKYSSLQVGALPDHVPALPQADCVLMLTVLNSIVDDRVARESFRTIANTLRPSGLLVVDDYPLIPTSEYGERYLENLKHDSIGIFKGNRGQLFRHRCAAHVLSLAYGLFELVTPISRHQCVSMNGRSTVLHRIVLRAVPSGSSKRRPDVL